MSFATRAVLFAYYLQFSIRWNIWAIATNIRRSL